MRTSTIILSKNIRIDKEYINVLSYNVEEMLNLLKSSSNLVKMISNCSFLRDRNYFTIEIDYNLALKVNYLAFTNPDYSNKWFFAFVDKIEYVSNKAVNIYYTLDHWTTWFNDWQPTEAFVIREHATNDSIGVNLIEEGLELGEPVVNTAYDMGLGVLNFTSIIVALTQNILDAINFNTGIYNGTYSGLFYAIFNDSADVNNFLLALANEGKIEIVNSIFYLPDKCISSNINYQEATYGGKTFNIGIPSNSDVPALLFTQNININGNLDGYSPVNNKLFTYPYNYLLVTNNAGSDAIYRYEDFSNNQAQFKCYGTLSVGGSIRLVPINYKNINFQDIFPQNMETNIYGLSGAKYPICGWVSNVYVNYLAQSSLNIQTNIARGTLNTALGVASGSGSQVLTGINQVWDQIKQIREHQFVPTQANGSANSGDIINAAGRTCFTAYRISVRKEIAQTLDDYFTKYGYKTLRYKIPNISTRNTFNYLQISADSVIGVGDVPAESMSIINNIARRGVTIYQNHSLI